MSEGVGSLLVRAGLVEPDQLNSARHFVGESGGTVPEQLVQRGQLDDEELTAFFRNRLLIPRVAPSDLAKLSSSLLERIPADMAVEFRSVPVGLDTEGNLTLAMSDPSDTAAVDEIGFFTGSFVVRAVATQAQIAWCLAHYYQQETDLYRDLVAKGHWPALRSPAEGHGEILPGTATREPDNEDDEDDEDLSETGPLSVPKRPTNQESSPPELSARSGEISSVGQAERSVDCQPAIIIDLGEELSVPQPIQRGTKTSPIILDDIKNSSVKAPIVLDKKKRHRPTNVGVGAAGRSPEEPTLTPLERAVRSHTGDDPDTSAKKQAADTSANEQSADRSAIEQSANTSAKEQSAAPASHQPPEDDEFKAPDSPEVAALFSTKRADTSEEALDQFSSAFLGLNDDGAVPQAIEHDTEVSELIPTSSGSGPVEVSASPDETIRCIEPESVRQITQENAAAKALVALRAIDAAESRTQIIEPMLGFLNLAFERTGFLVLRNDRLVTWSKLSTETRPTVDLDVNAESTLLDVVRMRLPYNGPLEDKVLQDFAIGQGLTAKANLLALPLQVRGRVVGVFFGLASQGRLFQEHITMLSTAASEALERMLLANRR